MQANLSFDIVIKSLLVQGIHMSLHFADGFAEDEILERMMEFLLKVDVKECVETRDIQTSYDSWLPYLEVDMQPGSAAMIISALNDSVLTAVEGYEEGIVINARTYPTRSTQEPEDDRVLHGSRDGFVETLILNTALVRRRIHDTHLRMEYRTLGFMSKSDIMLCYMDGLVDQNLLGDIRRELSEIHVEALTMVWESLTEALVSHRWSNPSPKVRYTECPDTASSNILEGKAILMINNLPNVLILSTSFFGFIQETQDYYLPPITGSYLRIVRILVFFLTLLVTPIWYYLNYNPQLTPDWLSFAMIQDHMSLPVIVQFLVLEFGIDVLKMTSFNTPGSLNSPFSVIDALTLGGFIMNAGWLTSEIILYMVLVALASFAQPSYELGYAIKFMRVMLLVLTTIPPVWGFWFGIALMLIIMASSRTVTSTSYFYPLFPFNPYGFKIIFVRKGLCGKSSNRP